MTAQIKSLNRLSNEASPYLQQHANNPVDWYPWGEDAFTKAKNENKPVFLSIGYSTCHWCHVMAHESFENEHIANILNQYFVSIKVDREELPAVDAIYMAFVQRTTGNGGWPLTVFLTPDAKPFYGGTYYPPSDSFGRPGFERLLHSIEDAWRNRQKEILASSDRITSLMQEDTTLQKESDVEIDILYKSFEGLRQMYDSQYGGFGGDPKFPQPSILSFLLIYAHRTRNPEALKMVENTLEKIAAGGIYDHLGGGLHRYSVDQKWLVPHFEKMLYDQALISRVYVQAYQITKKKKYKKIVKEIFDYVLRDLVSSESGFYSAEDADSEGHEGMFYVWKEKQIDTLLNSKEQEVLKAYFGVTTKGNFERGLSILHITMTLEEAAEKVGIRPDDAKDIMESAKRKLFQARQKRIRPHRDEKIIAGWNGLMISSLAYGGAVFNEPKYVLAAQRNAAFVLDKLYRDKRLMRYYTDSKSHKYAVLDDYTFLIRGLLDLYQADFNPRWLKYAIQLSDQMIELFEDKNNGGFFLTGSDFKEDLILRTRPDYDGAVPSGNSVAATELVRLAELTGNKEYYTHARKVLALFHDDLINRSLSLPELLCAVDLWIGPRSEIIMTAGAESEQMHRFLDDLRGHYLPRSVVLLRGSGTNAEDLEQISPITQSHQAIDQKTTVFLCEDFVCRKPITEYNIFQEVIEKLN